MRIVITGASGNIGTALLRRLSAARPGDTVVGLARRRPDESAEPYSRAEWHEIDVSRPDAFDRLVPVFTNADAVVHLAWRLQPNHREREMWATNVVGTDHVLAAASAARVPHVVALSSVGAYSRGPKRRRVTEDWPTGGLHTSHYSRHKAANERAFDRFEAANPSAVLTRVRPGLVFQRGAASELARLFAGAHLPTPLLGRIRLPVLAVPPQIVSQAVHADDLADALVRMIERRAGGPFNIAAEPVLGPQQLGEVLGAKTVLPLRRSVLRSVVWLTWKLRLQRSDPGWIDIAANAPVMSTARARTVLGWQPMTSSTDALREVLDGLGEQARTSASPPLAH